KQLGVKNKLVITGVSRIYRQQLTHQTIHGQFINIRALDPLHMNTHKAVSLKALASLPFPRFISVYLAENELPELER
ncbi:MAG TPA: hypothetical protein VHL77_03830, partial [Ferruginibacter sp.]|nr:hypothetical protein [Ferruginibacter sp.]